MIRDYDFKTGDLVLIRNTDIKKALNHKMWACYLGPLIIVSHNQSGAYIITELDGSVFDQPIAAFRVIPYFAHTAIVIPLLDDLLDISRSQLTQMKQLMSVDLEDDDADHTSEDKLFADDWGQSRVKLGGGMGQWHVWTLFILVFIFQYFFFYCFLDHYSLLATSRLFCLGISHITFKDLHSPSGLGEWR